MAGRPVSRSRKRSAMPNPRAMSSVSTMSGRPMTSTSRPTLVQNSDASRLTEIIASTNTARRYSALPGVRSQARPYDAQNPSVAVRVASGPSGAVSVVVVVIVLSLGASQGGLLARLDDQELSHHALVFVPQQVAVVHVRRGRIGEVVEPHEKAVVPIAFEGDRVLVAREARR